MLKLDYKFLVLLLAAYLFAKFSGGTLPYGILYALFLIFIISLINIFIYEKNFEVYIEVPKKTYTTGDISKITIKFSSDTFFQGSYLIMKSTILENFIKDYRGEVITDSLENLKIVTKDINFSKRGVYEFGKLSITLSDLFCIFTSNLNLDKGIKVKVYPKVYSINKNVFYSNELLYDLKNNVSYLEELSEVKEIRKYVLGDSLKKVHWKLSAKHNELYVKNFNEYSKYKCNVFLNMNKGCGSVNDEEKLVELCVSLVNEFNDKNIKSKVLINNKTNHFIDVNGHEDFLNLLEYFVSNFSEGEGGFESFLSTNRSSIRTGEFVGIITNELDKKFRNELVMMLRSGFMLAVFCVNSDISKSEQQWFENNGIKLFYYDEIISN